MGVPEDSLVHSDERHFVNPRRSHEQPVHRVLVKIAGQ